MRIFIFLLCTSPLFAYNRTCGNEEYFGPTGRCEPCGKLCDRPAEYPVSCQRFCPNYVAKEQPVSTTEATPSQWSSKPWIIGGLIGVCALIFALFLVFQIWKKLLKPCFDRLADQWDRKQLRLPTQEQSCHTGNDVVTPLNTLQNEESLNIDIGDLGR